MENLSSILVGKSVRLLGSKLMDKKGYTQREWDRAVGWGKVPPEYQKIDILEEIGPEPTPDWDEDGLLIEST